MHITDGDVVFTLNGREVRVRPDPHESLLETLRTRLGVHSPKDGCRPQGQCGACSAVVNDHVRVSCTVPTQGLQGARVVTMEGLADSERALIARAFAAAGAGQCGFCVPGIALHVRAIAAHSPHVTREDLARQLDLHLCRCGGYGALLDGAELLARGLRGEPMPAPVREGGVGASVARLDAEAQALGERAYVSDVSRPGMLFGALALSDYSRARVRGIDASAARATKGAVAVLTADDVPGERWQGLIERDWPVLVAVGEEVRCVGDVLAVVVAETEAAARAAATALVVDYEPLPPVLDPADALVEHAPRVNPAHANLLSLTVIHRGDAERGLSQSAHVARGTFRTQRIEHLFLEPECALAEPEGEGVAVLSQGQGIFDDRKQVAAMLGLPEERVKVTLMPPGGAFGGKEDLLVQAHAALAAFHTRRPVRVALTREQSIRMHPKRHPIEVEMALGCDADGALTALRARLLGDSGAYASVGAKVLERAAGHACGPYRVRDVDVEARAAYTNNPPCGAMRGFGVPQVAFALESLLDELAAKCGLDPWQMRYRNAIDPGDEMTTGQRLTASVGIKRTLLAVREAYHAARASGRAVGIACGVKNSGIGNGAEEWGRARLVVESPARVALYNGYTEMGQGLSTVLAQIASEASGLPTSVFEPRTDTTYQLACGQTTGSRATLFGGRAVKSAGVKLAEALAGGRGLADLVGEVFAADEVERGTTAPGAAVPVVRTHTSYGFATQVVVLDERGHLARVVAAHDVGRVVNPGLCAGQIEGAVVMGLGYALSEELECEDGMPTTFALRELGALRARDVPPIEVVFVEDHDPEGPYGAKGVGEIGLVPTAAAVANAVAAFDGRRRYVLPMKDTAAYEALHVLRAHGHVPHPPPAHHAHPIRLRDHGTR